MDLATRNTLTKELGHLVAAFAADLRRQIDAPGPAHDAALRLHADEGSGQVFPLWTDLLARRAAVLFVLKSVYVRVLEDRGLLRPRRIVDPESQRLFESLAPDLGETAYLRWVYRDLASARAGVPELFAPQPAEVAWPSHELSRRLLRFWRGDDPEKPPFRFDGEGFDSRFLGDLYQDLDPVVKARYALLQTPDFVLDFILDQTLTPAIAAFGVDKVRVLDPACGSGHFLLAALRRLFAGMRQRFPERPRLEVVQDCLARVVGIDLNDYACALARARLTMTALELSESPDLAAAGEYHPQVYCADALEQVEREEPAQLALLPGGDGEKPRALLTPPEVRVALRPVLAPGFQVVVGNPPYITEKDPKKRGYHREKVGKDSRYLSAHKNYQLGALFTERAFQLCAPGGWVGLITSNSFMRREFGKPLIEKVLSKQDLLLLVDTSGAHIPGHGTPTVLLCARRQPQTAEAVRTIMGKRGEPSTPADPAVGKVWTDIHRLVISGAQLDESGEFVSLNSIEHGQLTKHPWSLGGGGASDLKAQMDSLALSPLSKICISPIGRAVRTGDDEAFTYSAEASTRLSVAPSNWRDFLIGEAIRNWEVTKLERILFPYDSELNVILEADESAGSIKKALWPLRTKLASRTTFQGNMEDAGLKWFEFMQYTPSANQTPLSLAFAFVSTHNNFVIDRGGRVFNRTAPAIKFPLNSSEGLLLIMLAQLNSSAACFWMKQVCQPKAGSGIGRGVQSEDWMERYEHDGTKLLSFPLISTTDARLEGFGRALDGLARERQADSARAVIDSAALAGDGADALRAALDARRERDLGRLLRMVGLQEELDWLCYRLYGLDPDAPAGELRTPQDVPPLCPGLRPFELTLAREDAERRAALARGEEPDEAPTAWFERHGWEPRPDPEALTSLGAGAAVVAARLERTAASRELSLCEQPKYKRRWYRPDADAEEAAALAAWLADRVEAWARTQGAAFTARAAAAALEREPAVRAVVALHSGRRDHDLAEVLAQLLSADAVPGVKTHVYKDEGLRKRAAWEETWREQHRQDQGAEDAAPKVPPRYARADFLRDEYWQLRGPLDVPKERYVVFTELPELEGAAEPRFGWAGWTPRQRARALALLDEDLESRGVPVPRRHGLLWHLQSLLPYVSWESKEAAREYEDLLKTLCPTRLSDALLDEWTKENPPPARRKKKG